MRIRLLSVACGIALVMIVFFAENTVEPTASAPPLPISTTTPSAHAQNENWYEVAKVVDGDTVKILRDGKEVTLRLIGVDTPETVDPRKPVQCFGKAASDMVHTLLDGQSVRLELDPSQGEFDKYGRTLAYVYRPLDSKSEGLLVNKYLIAEGYGHEYTYRLPYKYQQEFKAAEIEARINKKGLWAPGVCESS